MKHRTRTLMEVMALARHYKASISQVEFMFPHRTIPGVVDVTASRKSENCTAYLEGLLTCFQGAVMAVLPLHISILLY
jgi:hypothetical protein